MKHNLKQYALCAALASAAMTVASCGDDLPDPIVLPRTAVDVQVDWSAAGAAQRPQSYVLDINGEQRTVTTESCHVELKSNNDYTFLAYVPVLGITVSDGSATIERSSHDVGDGNAVSGTPGTFYAAYATESPLTGDAKTVTMQMRQATRRLNISLRANVSSASGTPFVQGGYASVSNAFATYNMYTSLTATPVPAVSAITVDTAEGTVTAPFNLFGLDLDNSVKVDFVFFLSDGTQRRVSSDITDVVADFNSATDRTPLTIGGKTEVNGPDASITDWTVVDMGDINPDARK